jgi:DNA polymerase-1
VIAVQNAPDTQGRATKPSMLVNAELVLDVTDVELARAREALPRLVAAVAQSKVPLKAVAVVGLEANGDEAHGSSRLP